MAWQRHLAACRTLDQRVNEQRDDFVNIPAKIPAGDTFSSEMSSYAAIHDAIDPVIDEMVVPADWKEAVLKEITDQFGISYRTSTRIVYGESAQAIGERVLKKYHERVIDETAEIFNLKEEII